MFWRWVSSWKNLQWIGGRKGESEITEVESLHVWVGSWISLVKSLPTQLVPVLGETTLKFPFILAIFRLVSIPESHSVHSFPKQVTYLSYFWHSYQVCSSRFSVTFFQINLFQCSTILYLCCPDHNGQHKDCCSL